GPSPPGSAHLANHRCGRRRVAGWENARCRIRRPDGGQWAAGRTERDLRLPPGREGSPRCRQIERRRLGGRPADGKQLHGGRSSCMHSWVLPRRGVSAVSWQPKAAAAAAAVVGALGQSVPHSQLHSPALIQRLAQPGRQLSRRVSRQWRTRQRPAPSRRTFNSLGSGRLRMSSSWSPWRSWDQMMSQFINGTLTVIRKIVPIYTWTISAASLLPIHNAAIRISLHGAAAIASAIAKVAPVATPNLATGARLGLCFDSLREQLSASILTFERRLEGCRKATAASAQQQGGNAIPEAAVFGTAFVQSAVGARRM
uniref:VPS13_C domain-containing protein n=1 Tax=Macrostomum lignano TaxID=282301 RepID=A0A1I8F6Z1_9PLAT